MCPQQRYIVSKLYNSCTWVYNLAKKCYYDVYYPLANKILFDKILRFWNTRHRSQPCSEASTPFGITNHTTWPLPDISVEDKMASEVRCVCLQFVLRLIYAEGMGKWLLIQRFWIIRLSTQWNSAISTGRYIKENLVVIIGTFRKTEPLRRKNLPCTRRIIKLLNYF